LLLPRTIISGYAPHYPTRPHPLAERFGIILGLLRKGVADPRARRPLDPPRTLLLWNRLGRLVQRVAALIALATQPGEPGGAAAARPPQAGAIGRTRHPDGRCPDA